MNEKIESKINFSYLRRFNLIMGFLHLIQASIMVIMSYTIPQIRDFELPITTSYLIFNGFALVPDYQVLATVSVGPLVAMFLLLSAIAHFLTVLPKVNNFYNRKLGEGINYFRWFEYALSSSLMIVLIAWFFGVYDLSSMILIFCINATMNLLGLMMELHNQTTKKTNWASFYIGTFAGLIPWIVILLYLFGNGSIGEIPWFVWAIFGSYVIFFNTFPINMILQYKKVGKWKDYLHGERGYILLSLWSKTLLAWLVFAGVLQPV
ncbi:MAG: heliorhodopsin HeR [Candidatus Thorarchaeota archaeon]